jgi:hypothetical protein
MLDPCSGCFLFMVLFILSFLFMCFGVFYSLLLWCYVRFMSRGVVEFRWCCKSRVLLGYSNISFCHRRMMRRFCGYRLDCADCACGSWSWSNLVRVIVRNHFVNVYLGNYHDRMLC